ncbi:putative 26S proteasome regulatory subunit [Actinomortierella wolfii]|nr:putative 26S proteasome regulatory subunit [Actinomortierella wolfii]
MSDTTFTHQSPMDTAQALLKEKDAIEAHIRVTEMELQAHNVGPNERLIDAEGFPRADIDLVAITTLRAKLAKLKNDLKFLMPKIEEALYKVHEAAREEKNKAGSATQGTQAESSTVAPQPFARVNAVAPDSPASEGGLIRGDQILHFGPIDATNHNHLKALNDHVVAHQNQPIVVKVLRAKDDDSGMDTVVLSVTPRLGWGGRGLLGYTTYMGAGTWIYLNVK